MPFTVQKLIEGRQKPITISPQDTVQKALTLMIEYDFSQLPVVDERNKPLGIVTSDSIIRALSNFGVPLADLQVSHAIVKVDKYRPDEDLFDRLDDLKNTYAVLIVNAEGTLIGIVTSYDTTDYFRRRAEDMMFVEDIETTLKDFIRAAFHVSDESDQQKLATVITEMSDAELRKKFHKALNLYLSHLSQSGTGFDKTVAEEVFAKAFTLKDSPRSLKDLTLNEYIQLLLHKSMWHKFSSIFQLDADAVRNLLDGVRKTRNDLAHFHGEISTSQRTQLHFCIEWLERQRQAVLNAFQASADIAAPQQEVVSLPGVGYTIESAGEEIAPVEEPLRPDDSRYAPLALWLQQQSPRQERITLTFNQIEEIIGEALPASARQHRSWWANDSIDHVQSRQWLDVGWRVSNIAMGEERVTFTRIREREKLYISFFSGLLQELKKAAPFHVRDVSPDGFNWIVVASLSATGIQMGYLAFSFARYERLRVEFYIDTGEKEKNKRLFDAFYLHKDEMQAEVKGIPRSLEWERMDDKRASRIAFYHPGAITYPPEQLAQLQTWAVDAMIIQEVIEHHAVEALHVALA